MRGGNVLLPQIASPPPSPGCAVQAVFHFFNKQARGGSVALSVAAHAANRWTLANPEFRTCLHIAAALPPAPWVPHRWHRAAHSAKPGKFAQRLLARSRKSLRHIGAIAHPPTCYWPMPSGWCSQVTARPSNKVGNQTLASSNTFHLNPLEYNGSRPCSPGLVLNRWLSLVISNARMQWSITGGGGPQVPTPLHPFPQQRKAQHFFGNLHIQRTF